MQIFLDTANLEDINLCAESGLIDGITTNPTLIAREGVELKQRILEILEIVDGPVSVEVVTSDPKLMLEQALEYASWHPNVYVKLPCTPDGLSVLKILKTKKIKVNMTLVFSLAQAVCCAKLGADFVSPFIGRLDDIGQDGMELVASIQESFQKYGLKTQVLAASIRSVQHITESMIVGADIATIPVSIFHKMLRHPLTDTGQAKFLADYINTTHAQS
ncbi:fructose-6-phosphate aldolase [bacterium]|jgi:transaldolase|nr:fructose-6-phosphate aldolase [bacterium]